MDILGISQQMSGLHAMQNYRGERNVGMEQHKPLKTFVFHFLSPEDFRYIKERGNQEDGFIRQKILKPQEFRVNLPADTPQARLKEIKIAIEWALQHDKDPLQAAARMAFKEYPNTPDEVYLEHLKKEIVARPEPKTYTDQDLVPSQFPEFHVLKSKI